RGRGPAPQRSSTGRPITLSHHREAEYAGEGARATKKFDRSAYHSFSPPRGRVRGRGRPRHKEVRQVGLSLFLTTERQSTREGARATKKFDRSAYHSFSPPRGRVRGRAPAPPRSSTGRPITLSHHREAEYAGGRPRHKEVRQVGLSLFLTTERQSTRARAPAPQRSSTGRPITLSHHREAEYAGEGARATKESSARGLDRSRAIPQEPPFFSFRMGLRGGFAQDFHTCTK